MESSFKRGRYRLLSGVATGAALLFATTSLAVAQEAPTEDEGSSEIVVTGFRASLANSTNIKRTNSSIVEAVSAEDIGKLPDNSIAEALARLPGLTAQRVFGRAQSIAVRGLSGDFSTALLNGREQVSAGDNRNVEFDQYPSELLQRVVVYKTPDAALIGTGLAGTADMQTVRPLAVGEQVFAVSGRYEWNEVGALNSGSDDTGYRITGTYIDQSEDGRWGWAFGAAFNSSPTQAERWEAWGYDPPFGQVLGDDGGPVGPVPDDVRVIGGAKPYVHSSLLERDGYFGVIEYAPSDTFRSTVDLFYSEFEETQILRGIEFPLRWGSTLQPGWTAENGLLTSGTFTDVKGVVRNDIRTRQSTVLSGAWAMEFGLGGDWVGATDLSYSSVERNDLDLELWAGTAFGAANGTKDVFDFEWRGDDLPSIGDPLIDYARRTGTDAILLTSPQGWGSAGFIKEPQTDDELQAIRLGVAHDYDGPVSRVEFGVNYADREKNKDSIEAFIDLAAGPTAAVELPAELELEPTAFDFLNIPGSLSFDPVAALNFPGLYVRRPLRNSDVLAKAWQVEEQVTTFYGKFDLDTTFMQLPLRGNVGMQVVTTEQSSTGAAANDTVGISDSPFTVQTLGTEFTEALPSANFSFEVGDNRFLKIGLARTMARPRMDQMRASFEIGYNQTNETSTDANNSYWNGSGGNPFLRPWIAKSADISYEHYFGGAGYFAVAVFYKELESFIYDQGILYDFTGFPIQDPTDLPGTVFGVATIPANGEGGEMKGLELTLSLPGEVITPALEGFGILANGAFNDSSVDPDGPNGPRDATDLPGLSEETINVTLYFERAGFEARLSNRYRSDFLGEVVGFGAGLEPRRVHSESVLDGQIGYRFYSGPLEGLSVLFQANNITDEPFRTFANDDERQIRDFQVYGTSYLFGLSYRR